MASTNVSIGSKRFHNIQIAHTIFEFFVTPIILVIFYIILKKKINLNLTNLFLVN